jgi:hypothetical protein
MEEVVERLSSVTDFTPEYEGESEDIFLTIKESYDSLLRRYPRLESYGGYLEFLRRTGGAFIDHQDFSLGIYGFEGYVVTSFNESRLFLDRNRYFHFGDVLYADHPDLIYVFAFDFESEKDIVLVAENEKWEYAPCSPSFKELLLGFASGRYPAMKE